MDRRLRLAVLLVVTAVAAGVVFAQPRLPQDPAYHLFVDTRLVFGIPNAWNVLSNLPFLIIGLLGIAAWTRAAERKAGWLCFFVGIALTAFGSAWYHLAPSNETLLWDRLPMTLGFMALFAGVIGERISEHAYRLLLWPLIGVGVASVLYWYASERDGAGDLRLYVLVQFFPLLTIPLIMALYEPRYTHGRYILFALAAYAAAKACEVLDRQIGDLTAGILCGHALKHLVAAFACYLLFVMYRDRALSRPL